MTWSRPRTRAGPSVSVRKATGGTTKRISMCQQHLHSVTRGLLRYNDVYVYVMACKHENRIIPVVVGATKV